LNRKLADVLLAEDNPSDAELILDSLASVVEPKHVHRVHHGVETIDFPSCKGDYTSRLSGTPLRPVLLDIKLPRMDGLEVLEHIRADPRTSLVPVVMLTSSKVDRDVRSAYELGANAFVQKPVDFPRFREALRCLGTFWLSINEGAPLVGRPTPRGP
jgi:two-component system response regulator